MGFAGKNSSLLTNVLNVRNGFFFFAGKMKDIENMWLSKSIPDTLPAHV